ncbi:hypothetical protein [Actinopolymorpha pittospori]
MANEKQFRARTRIVATRGVAEYRATIPALVDRDDVVLEVGCECRRPVGPGPANAVQ